jgi:Phage integrase, N-terminal SAM-like domain
MDDIRAQVAAEPARFIDQLRSTIRQRGLSYATEKIYVHWALRFIHFHQWQHPEGQTNKSDTYSHEHFLVDVEYLVAHLTHRQIPNHPASAH